MHKLSDRLARLELRSGATQRRCGVLVAATSPNDASALDVAREAALLATANGYCSLLVFPTLDEGEWKNGRPRINAPGCT
jgi:hypothetical protein